jgi:hypothetical protein
LRKAWNYAAMVAAGTVARIPIDFGHGRSWEAGQMKEDDEGIPALRARARMKAEQESELTALVKCEPFIRKREKTRKRSGQVVGADGDRTSSEKYRR